MTDPLFAFLSVLEKLREHRAVAATNRCGCSEAARRWRRAQASRRYRASAAGRERRRAQGAVQSNRIVCGVPRH
jgi:hypothetical protein